MKKTVSRVSFATCLLKVKSTLDPTPSSSQNLESSICDCKQECNDPRCNYFRAESPCTNSSSKLGCLFMIVKFDMFLIV